MYYEINISKNGVHFFATAERSATTEDKARELYSAFCAKFPESEGYKINVTHWHSAGQHVDFSEGK